MEILRHPKWLIMVKDQLMEQEACRLEIVKLLHPALKHVKFNIDCRKPPRLQARCFVTHIQSKLKLLVVLLGCYNEIAPVFIQNVVLISPNFMHTMDFERAAPSLYKNLCRFCSCMIVGFNLPTSPSFIFYIFAFQESFLMKSQNINILMNRNRKIDQRAKHQHLSSSNIYIHNKRDIMITCTFE